jgi:hypothetical protein
LVWSSDLRRALEESFSPPAGRDDANRLLPDGLPHAEIETLHRRSWRHIPHKRRHAPRRSQKNRFTPPPRFRRLVRCPTKNALDEARLSIFPAV